MRVRTAVVALVLVLGAGVLLLRNPLRLSTTEVAAPAPRPTGSLVTAEAVLVASPDRVAERSAAGQRDDSFAWAWFLEQEIGPWRLAEPGALASGALDGARLVIVPDTAWDDLDDADRAALAAVVSAGRAAVVVEGPADRAVRIGPGTLSVSDFARTLAALQQGGVADTDAAYRGVAQGLVQPHGFRTQDASEPSFEPTADLLEDGLLARIDASAPAAGWWRFPDAASAYVAVTHDEEGFGDRSAWLPEALAAQGVASSAFVETEGITGDGVAAMQAARSDVHLHWDRGFLGTEPREPVHIAGFAPATRRPSLREQADAARVRGFDMQDIVLNRTHGLVFDPDPVTTFRMLHAAGVDVDSTYGPAGAGRFGYLFGTGLPFRPLDATGWPFPLLEVPFVFQDDEHWSRPEQDRIVREAASTHHQLVVTVYHVNAMARMPSTDRMDGLLEIGELADDAGATHGSLLPFISHWQARLVSPLRTTHENGVLRVDADAQADGMSVRLPAQVAERPGAQILLDGQPCETHLRGRHLLVPVPAGPHVIEVRLP